MTVRADPAETRTARIVCSGGARGAGMWQLEERTGRQVQGGALYVTLDRLEQKGYVVSRMGEPDTRRGGRPRRFVEVTPAGVRALGQHREALLRIWEGLESMLGDA
jgi:DNA-binding PadR family transcriptional regulator